jgi:Phage tail protein (Tail_P2_I)
MEYTRQLIDFFPDRIRDRIDQDEDTLIAHFANAIQPGLDAAIDIIENEPDFYDPEICPVGMIDWLGQLVGLAKAGNNHLGLGLGSAWTNQHKRMAIARAWHYWQIKGTTLGVTEAISIWLDWNPTPGNSLEIKKPFGEVPIHTPPQWAGWNRPYYHELIVPYRQVRRWGGGEIPGDNHLTNYSYLPPVGSQTSLDGFIQVPVAAGAEQLVSNINTGIAIPDLTIAAGVQRLAQRQLIRSRGAANSTNRPWMHFLIEQGGWGKISPSIAHLNPEIWSARTDAVPFTWLNLTPTIPVPLTAATTADLFCQSSSWRLTVITTDEAYSVRPITNYLLDATGKGKFVPTQSQETQSIEFAFTPIRIAAIRRIQITYLGAAVLNFVPTKALHLDPLIQFGVVAKFAATIGVALPVVGVALDVPIVGVELTPLPIVRIGYSQINSEGTDTNATLLIGQYFYLSRAGSVLNPLTVTVNFSGTAIYGSDWFKAGESPSNYTTASATVTFAIGASSADLVVKIRADALVEPDEYLIATIVPAADITLIPGENFATLTILDDDVLPVNPLSATYLNYVLIT